MLEAQNPGKYYYRALRMLELKISGNDNKQIAKRFQVTEKTVKDSLDFAIKQGVVEDLEQKIIKELVPQAIEVYREALNSPSHKVDVAKDLLTKLVQIGTRSSKQQQHREQLGLKAYLDAKRTHHLPPNSASAGIISINPVPIHQQSGSPTDAEDGQTVNDEGSEATLSTDDPQGDEGVSDNLNSDELAKSPTTENSVRSEANPAISNTEEPHQ